ncbi:symmetrical bis(5'-nucleosyl)-tetraphosphatase [Nitrogeniibacter mangrovi]|uniref:Bis(5'-nucleosyl)-tetraphosphatase, symmetrical n=1 Tax=Nitrogeniibacter mangrovi TaxID=2016596 RepID=A0A6C1B282_9RHOO|nr:symmetrical bis(5'-nucleosyl)-tetraphosphatase [Nitrogeniibacter mangrovi]QID17005.1 symmetrical bis(5'-nucleosyl)-tetraphosphatase [Nitrogeniibacter mangrovi]
MARYAIGDIQGCFDSLQALLAKLGFDPREDVLWSVGDLVNRGPKSLQVLRFFRELGDGARVVLGNHDLYLLMVAAGWRKRGKDDTLQPVLDAPDADALLEWLAHQSLMHVDDGFAMVHAGLLPQWEIGEARALAAEVESMLGSDRRDAFLADLAGNTPASWSAALEGQDRLRCIVNAMTRMRFCTPDGTMEFKHKGPPSNAPAGAMPWFEVPGRRHRTHTVITGHWSALGLYRGEAVVSLDTGCLWGGRLTAYRLEDARIFQVDSVEKAA